MARCIASSTLNTPPDTYLFTLAQSSTTFATIGSDNHLRLFDPSLKPLSAIPIPTALTTLTPFGTGFATGGQDSKILTWDPRTRGPTLQLADPRGAGIASIISHEHLIAAGTESAKEGLGDVSVLLFDARSPATPVRAYVESHSDSVTRLAFHPEQKNVLLSGSTDGLVSFFDVNVVEEEDALVRVLNPRSAVHCAGFLTGEEVFVVTTDEQFSIYSLREDGGEGKEVKEFGDVRGALGCMYVVDLIPGPQPVLVCGHNVEETLSIVQLEAGNGWGFGAVIDLPGAHGEEVVRDLLLLGEEKKALSCGEDGRVKLWDLTSAVPRSLGGTRTG